jgi:hypothetical protein
MIERRISEAIRKLPVSLQQELLDFVDFLLIRAERQEAREWGVLSLASAMQGIESEESLYTLEDLKVVFG